MVQAAAAAPGATPASVLSAAASAAPAAALRKFVAVRTAGSATHGGVCVQAAAIQTFLLELRGTPLFDAVAAAVPRRDGSADLDAVMPTNCYEPGSAGCGDPADGCCHPANDAGMAASAQQPGCAAEAAPAEAAGAADGQPAADLAATAAASSAPALAASAAQPAVREDLTAERAAMLLLLAPREVWREVGDEALRRGLLALLDTSSHSGAAAAALAARRRCVGAACAGRGAGPPPHPPTNPQLRGWLWPRPESDTSVCPLHTHTAPHCHTNAHTAPLPCCSGGGRGGVPVCPALAAAHHAGGAGGERGVGAHLRRRSLPARRPQRAQRAQRGA